ncbi:MAG: hypothetical protein PHG91_12725 [Syntrophales bacterium]|nr:hypothetical protein [Syntrophales bacterium]MDD5234250.1 hypothetical protein [Syntrophales bacterium]
MVRKRKEPLDEIFRDKTEEFDHGIERKRDDDLDESIWELGDYENREPLAGEEEEYRETVPSEEVLFERELRENGAVTERGELDIEAAPAILKIEITGKEYEIVCGRISGADLERVVRACEKENMKLADYWYDRSRMARVLKKWPGWYERDDIAHDIGLAWTDPGDLDITILLDYEPVDPLEPGDIHASAAEKIRRPALRRRGAAVTAGSVSEARYYFELETEGAFDPGKLEFILKDLKEIGVDVPLLAEVLYDGETMRQEHEDMSSGEPLDVIVLK